jgi:hypothetical protein
MIMKIDHCIYLCSNSDTLLDNIKIDGPTGSTTCKEQNVPRSKINRYTSCHLFDIIRHCEAGIALTDHEFSALFLQGQDVELHLNRRQA